ncbi:MAG: hypothetical protein M1836_007981 [Candelina mexicana]|nr:MAG: hypothetical protein M1836_007981 [Candelina mexicana]
MSSLTASNLFNVNGLVAVITGGGTGIGLMIAKALASNGASKVYIIGRRKDRLESAAQSFSINNNIIPLVGDITSKSSLEALASQIMRETGYINVLVANSGITGPTLRALKPDATIQEMQEYLWKPSMEEFNETYNVNTTGVFYTTVAFLELLDKGNKKGNVEQQSQVIATSSIGAYNRVPAAGFAYGSSKAAVIHMMKQLGTKFAGFGIRANVLAPGLYPSEMTTSLIRPTVSKETIPAERLGTEEDMAGTILYLTSKAGAYCNGNVIITDGGRLCITPVSY